MSTVKSGDTIRVHYTGRLSDGQQFDSSSGSDPLEFTVGDKQVIPGFESAVVGLSEGASTTVVIPAEEAYGEVQPDQIARVERSQFPKDVEPEVGQRFAVGRSEEDQIVATVTEVTDSHVTLDGNHPLAGEDLTFDIELVEIL